MPDWGPEIHKRLAGVRLSPTREAEIVDELSQHLDDRFHDLVDGGMAPEEAERAALAGFRGQDVLGTQLSELRQARWREPDRGSLTGGLLFDVRQSFRALLGSPGFTLVALAVLTLGIGATTAIISVVDAVALRPLPFADPQRLMAVTEFNSKANVDDPGLVAPQNFQDWRDQQDVFTGLAAVGFAAVSLKAEDGYEPEMLKAQAVTADFFSVLGTQPLMGRPFTRENERDGNAFVAVISHGLWKRRYGGAADVIGKYLHGQRAEFQIVGVMPESFSYPVGALQPTEVWLPNVFRADERVRGNEFSYRLQVIGRLRPGVSMEHAQERMDGITAGLAAATPRWFEDRTARVEPLLGSLTKTVRGWMMLLMAAAALVLLIACVNLSNLTLARATARSKEFAIRAALGASRWQVTRPLLMESVLLSVAGAAAGVMLAWWGVDVLRAALPAEVPRVAEIGVNIRVLIAALALATLTGPLVSALPMAQLSRTSGASALASRANSGTSGQSRFRGWLVISEVAVAVVLLVGAGLFLASFHRVTSVDLGLDPNQVLTIRVRPRPPVGKQTWEEIQRASVGLMRNVLQQTRTIPGVEAAAFVNGGVPLRGDLRTADFAIPGRTLPPNEDLDFNEISPDYFRALRVPLRSGRFFTEDDRQGSEPVAILNEAAARHYFPGENPIGKAIRFEGLRTVIGVTGNIRHDGPEGRLRRQGFIPLDQSTAAGGTLVLRLSRDAQHVLPFVKDAIRSQFSGVPLPDIQSLEQYLQGLIAQRRFNMLLLVLFGGLGIVIALVGIYGLLSFDVTARTREIGIRMALGALPGEVMRWVLRRASAYLAVGLLIGLMAALSLSGLIRAFLFQVQPHDLLVYSGVGALLVTTGLCAAFLPARRAARADPLNSLRQE